MKKWLAWMLVCLLALTPVCGLAYESPADAAYSEGKLVRTTYTFVPGTLPFFTEEIQAAYTDIFEALNVVGIRQANDQTGNAGGVAVTLNGASGAKGVLDLVWGSDADGLYLLSESGLLGQGMLAFTREGILEEGLKLVNAVSQLFGGPEITMEMVQQALAENTSSAQQMMEEAAPMMEAVTAKIMEWAAKAQVAAGAVESDKHDAADTTVTLDLTNEDIASYYDVIVEELLKMETFQQFLAVAEITDEQGKVLYGEEGIEYFKKTMREVPATIREMGINAKVEALTAGDELVGLIVTLTAEGEEEAIVLDYYRKTVEQTATHTFALKGGAETLLDGEYVCQDLGAGSNSTLAVRVEGQNVVQGAWSSASDGYEKAGNLVISDGTEAFGITWNSLGDNWSFSMEAASGGESQFLLSLAYQKPDFTLRVEADGEAFVLTYDETETVDKLAWVLELAMEAGDQKDSMLKLDYVTAASANGGEEGSLGLSVMGFPCLTVKAETMALDPLSWSSYAKTAVSDMTAADASQWVQNMLGNLMNQAMTFIQNLPASVMKLMGE